MKRRTVGETVEVRGIGLSSRRPVSVRLKPGRPGQGIVFNDRIPATVSRASVSEHRTCIGRGRHKVHQVEHLMAACAGLGITDLGVDVEGSELPFGDGSSLHFYHALRRAGVLELDQEIVPITDRHCTADAKFSFYCIAPGRRLSVMLYGSAPGYGDYDQYVVVTPESFAATLAGARTFGPVAGQAWQLRRRLKLDFGLKCRAGWVYPKDERMPKEPGCHKILDLLGDLWLLGRPILANIEVCRPNHRMNLALVRELEAH